MIPYRTISRNETNDFFERCVRLRPRTGHVEYGTPPFGSEGADGGLLMGIDLEMNTIDTAEIYENEVFVGRAIAAPAVRLAGTSK